MHFVWQVLLLLRDTADMRNCLPATTKEYLADGAVRTVVEWSLGLQGPSYDAASGPATIVKKTPGQSQELAGHGVLSSDVYQLETICNLNQIDHQFWLVDSCTSTPSDLTTFKFSDAVQLPFNLC